MKPPIPRDRLEAWLRGELDEADSERFVAAWRDDPEIGEDVAAHAGIRDRVRGLATERTPERDLWPEIARRVAERPVATGHGRRLATLAAALAVAAGVAYLVRPSPPTSTTVETPSVAPPAAVASVAPVPAAYAATGAELDAIRARLREEIERRSGELPPEARSVVLENLATIDRAIAAIEAELAGRPDDLALARTAIAYRQRQLELLRRVNQTASRL